VIGEVTEERLATVRKATVIVEQELANTRAFQYFAVLLTDQATAFATTGAVRRYSRRALHRE
jgi:GMP synthase PP-ATPase subunit